MTGEDRSPEMVRRARARRMAHIAFVEADHLEPDRRTTTRCWTG
ncbi:hypothetical protein AB0L59_36595 [Streptomyces sp. NPDC052109]